MISIVFGLLTACFFAMSSLISSRTVKVIGSSSSVAWVMLVGLAITTPFLAFTGVPEGVGSNIGWLALAGIGNVAGILLAGFAFRFGKVGIVAPITATEGAIAAVIAAMFGESIAPIVAFLLMVIVTGIVLSAVASDPEPLVHERPLIAALLATSAAIGFGTSLFAVGHLSADLPIPWLLLPARLVGVLAITIPLAVARRLRITRGTAPLLVAMGVGEVIAYCCFAIGAQYQVAVTSVLSSQFAPIATVMAYLLFKERLGRLQIAGIVVLGVGVTGLGLAS